MRIVLLLLIGSVMVPWTEAVAQDRKQSEVMEQKVEKEAKKKRGRDLNMIREDEIAELQDRYRNAVDLIQFARPRFLKTRGATRVGASAAGEYAAVYVNDVRFGDIQSLRSLPSEGLVSIQWLSAAEATTRFGYGNTDGAILITQK